MLYDQQQPSRAPSLPSPGRTFNTPNQQFYSNSAPNLPVNFPVQRQLNTRPPVPLFGHSTGNINHPQQLNRNTMTEQYAFSFDNSLDGGFGTDGDFEWDAGTSFTAVNNGTGTTSTSTVSPKDLFNDFLGSAPPSTAFTNLTSPDINASPYMVASSTEVSPLFQDNVELGGESANWYSLFPDAGNDQSTQVAPPMQRNDSNITDGSATDSPMILDEHNFRRKSSNNSPGYGRHSSISGVKPRRRKAPLPPIAVDAGDKVAVKRARNTLAARESRQRKLDHLGSLEARIKELEDREEQFKATLASYGYNGPLMQM